MTIEPDTKDWTWVLERACPECGLDLSQVAADEVAGRLRLNAAAWVELLQEPGVRERPSPLVWSPLEYACHVRDVFTLYAARLARMLDQDDPLFPNWDQDVTAVAERYGEQDPALVSDELALAGEALAAAFEAVADEQWRRLGRRSDGARFTVESFALYLLHDPVHHLWDVTGVSAAE